MVEFYDNTVFLNEIFKRDEATLEYLYHRYFRRLKGYAYRYTEDEDIAQDIVQECFIKLWEKSAELKCISIKSLLFTMVRNRCLNYLKKQKNSKKLLSEYITRKNAEKLYYTDFNIDDNSLYSELELQISRIVNNLPQRCKEVFILSRYTGLKNREIAQKLDISTTAVEKHISKALKQIEEYLKII